MASAIHQHESAIDIHISPPSWTFLPPPSPSHPARLSQSTSFRSPASYSKLSLAIYFTYGNVYVSMLLSQFIPPFSSLTVSTSLFSIPCLHCWLTSRFISTIFLNSIYVLIYDICFSFSDLSLYIIGSRSIHLIRTDSSVFLFTTE